MVFVLAFTCLICDMFLTGSEIIMQDKGNLMFLTGNTEIFTEMASRLAGKASEFTQKISNHSLNCLSISLHTRFVDCNQRLVKVFNYTAKTTPREFNFYLSSF